MVTKEEKLTAQAIRVYAKRIANMAKALAAGNEHYASDPDSKEYGTRFGIRQASFDLQANVEDLGKLTTTNKKGPSLR